MDTLWDLAAFYGKAVLCGIGFGSGLALYFWCHELPDKIRVWRAKRGLKRMSRWS